jgi:PAS domain S-box-containing protein
MGLDGKVININPALCAMYGYTCEELIGQTSALVVHPDDYPRAAQSLQDLLAGKVNQFSDERRYIRKDGEVFWARIAMSMVRDARGAPLNIVGMVADINEQRLALAKLQESEARFRAIYENAAIGISLIAPDGRVLAVNPVLAELAGRSESELTALGGQGITYPEDQDVGRPEFYDVMAGKRDSYQVEKRYVHRDGRVQWMRQSVSAVRDAAGKPLYLVVIAEDIDERKRAVEELRESEARFRAMYDNAAVGMAMVSLDRRILSVNETSARITGYSVEELRNSDPGGLSHPDDVAIGMAQFRDLVAGKIPQLQMEKRFIRKGGEIFWGRVSYSAVPGKDGRPEYLVGLIEDISEERLAQEQLAAQETAYRRQLEQRIAERTEELSAANERLREKAAQDAVIAERTRLARDLHDAVTQTLFSTTLIAEVIPDLWEMNPVEGQRRLEELRLLTRGALAEMRTLLVELRPNALTEIPLPVLLRQLTEAIAGRSRITIQLNAEGERYLPADVQVGLYRIAQEALNNVFKHARATQAIVTLRLGDPVRLTVADNGTGFDPGAVSANHLGLRIMRERAEGIGAHFSLYSEPGEGTQISVVWNVKT